jgi:hypothetical protein
MMLKTTNEWYNNKTEGPEFKHFHRWDIVKHQPKWRAKCGGEYTTNLWVSLSEPTTEKEGVSSHGS